MSNFTKIHPVGTRQKDRKMNGRAGKANLIRGLPGLCELCKSPFGGSLAVLRVQTDRHFKVECRFM